MANSFYSSAGIPDELQFSGMFKEYYSRLCLFACRITGNRESSEDIVQDCFLKLWQRKHEIDWTVSIGPYLYTMVRYSAYHYNRDRQGTEILSEFNKEIADEQHFLHQLVETETLHEIYKAIQALPPKCGNIFRALYLDDKKVKEVSVEHKISTSTIRSHKAAALAILRHRIELVLMGIYFFIG